MDRTRSAMSVNKNIAVAQRGPESTALVPDATFLTFAPGLYSVEFSGVPGGRSDMGLPLPCAYLSPAALTGSAGRAVVTTVPEGGWLSRQTKSAHILVVGGQAGAVLTIYRPTASMPLPEVRFVPLLSKLATVASRLAAETELSEPATAAQPAPTLITAHVENIGDQIGGDGHWVGDVTGNHAIEGFHLAAPAGIAPGDLEYQAVMGEDWRTPWFSGGQFCGSRGLQLPLLGFQLRLAREAADRFNIQSWGCFGAGNVVGPSPNGEDVQCGGLPLTAMKIQVSAK